MADHLLTSFSSPRGATRAFIVGALAAGLVVMTGTWRLATRGENCVPTPSALWRATHTPRPADFTISVAERSAPVAPPGYHVSGVEVSGDSARFSSAIPARDICGARARSVRSAGVRPAARTASRFESRHCSQTACGRDSSSTPMSGCANTSDEGSEPDVSPTACALGRYAVVPANTQRFMAGRGCAAFVHQCTVTNTAVETG